MTIVVNISDARVSKDAADTLATYSLGSCIGVALYDPVTHVGGMLHFQLPNSSIDPERAKQNPMMFADTGLMRLLADIEGMGVNRRRMKVTLAGAAQMLNDNNLFNIGRRNHAAVRKVLWAQGLLIDGEDIGGNSPRNMYLRLADGTVQVKAGGKTMDL